MQRVRPRLSVNRTRNPESRTIQALNKLIIVVRLGFPQPWDLGCRVSESAKDSTLPTRTKKKGPPRKRQKKPPSGGPTPIHWQVVLLLIAAAFAAGMTIVVNFGGPIQFQSDRTVTVPR